MSAISLKFLKTFQIAAQVGSFATTAIKLRITASAVSHQIRGLETQLAVALFTRGPRELTLTEAGKKLLKQIDPAFAQLESATTQLRNRSNRTALRLQVPPFFAQELLLPRLGAFSAAHPETDLQIATRSAPPEPHSTDADVSVALGTGQWPDLLTRRLFAQTFVPACSPGLLQTSGVSQFTDLARESLIVHSRRIDLWDRWAEQAGLANLQPRQQIRFDTMSAVVDAAERGVGFALVSAPLARARFDIGTLSQVFSQQVGTGESYFAVTRAADASLPAVRALLDWMVSEFGEADRGHHGDEEHSQRGEL